jgi:N-acyl-D-aspartate/D-glutamate deacylase
MDLVLRNGVIIDGTGQPTFKGDVLIRNGRIESVGDVTVDGTGAQELDVGGASIAPGFIDVHTHFDAQAFWDPLLTPSIFHGVTTAIAGNCGFTLAPLSGKPEDADYLLRMLAKVEGMPLSTLRASVKPDWKSFGDYLNRLDGTLALNTIFMVGHSALRRTVMGERAVGEEATEDDIEKMCALLDQSLSEGGAGFSTTVSVAHNDYEGQPVPSRSASRDEIMRLCTVLRGHTGTWLEIVNGKFDFTDEDCALLTDMSLAAQRPLNWNLITVFSESKHQLESQLRASDYAQERGATVYGLIPSLSPKVILNFISGFVLDVIPEWAAVLALPHDEKRAALGDPSVREKLKEGTTRMEAEFLHKLFADWRALEINSVGSDKNQKWVDQLLGDYADAQGKEPLDALFDLAVEEDLNFSFSPPPGGEDDESWQMRADTWCDDRAIIGASDAGAHLDMINTFAFSTQLLGNGVRERKLIPLEEAVRRITSVPAERFGIKDRGRIEPGMIADITVFRPDTIDCGPISMRDDLPEGQSRLYADAIGVDHVIINGQIVVESGKPTGTIPGRVLRSGKDTQSVAGA